MAARSVSVATSPVTERRSTKSRSPGTGRRDRQLLPEPLFVAVGAGRLRPERHHPEHRRHRHGGSEEEKPSPLPDRTDVDAMAVAALALTAKEALAEAAVRTEGLAFAPPPLLAKLAQSPPRPFHQKLKRIRCARGRGRRFSSRQFGRSPGVAPWPQPEAEEVGRHQGQLPASDLAGDRGHARQRDEDGQRQPYPGGTEGGEAVGAVGEGRDGRQGHDLGEGEPEQDAVLGLHVGGYFVCLHLTPPIRAASRTGTWWERARLRCRLRGRRRRP